MSTKDTRPEARSVGAAAEEATDKVVDSAKYLKDRVTAPVSGESRTDQDVKETASEKADEAKEHTKGVFESISDGAKYVGSRFTASPSGDDTKGSAEEAGRKAKGEANTFFGKAQEATDKVSDKAEHEKNKAKDKYEDTQQTIADRIATNPVEEARAQGQIPADTATVNAVEGKK